MKTGTLVQVRQPAPIRGAVTARRINPGTDAIELLVSWEDPGGASHQRWFAEAELQEVAAPAVVEVSA